MQQHKCSINHALRSNSKTQSVCASFQATMLSCSLCLELPSILSVPVKLREAAYILSPSPNHTISPPRQSTQNAK
jgi:hypothetical protein